MPEGSMKEAARQRRYEKMREKVLQWAKDVWRPYHGSTRHVEEDDGNQMISKEKSGGHTPLNAAVMALWGDSKLSSSRDLFMRQLYRLAVGTPKEVLMFALIQELFERYGAGDSDYETLRQGAIRDREARSKTETDSCRCERVLKALIVDEGIDTITKRLIAEGVTPRDFWADFGLPGLPTSKTATKEEDYRKYYLDFEARCVELSRTRKRFRNRALQQTADHFKVSKRTVEEAVSQIESGYVSREAS